MMLTFNKRTFVRSWAVCHFAKIADQVILSNWSPFAACLLAQSILRRPIQVSNNCSTSLGAHLFTRTCLALRRTSYTCCSGIFNWLHCMMWLHTSYAKELCSPVTGSSLLNNRDTARRNWSNQLSRWLNVFNATPNSTQTCASSPKNSFGMTSCLFPVLLLWRQDRLSMYPIHGLWNCRPCLVTGASSRTSNMSCKKS